MENVSYVMKACILENKRLHIRIVCLLFVILRTSVICFEFHSFTIQNLLHCLGGEGQM